ncbi:MAG: DUF190 domain-containing protein [Euryarchaeota archaeon]|nr:DUF190 domain-containing protein [Euryarchaeota archaeon]
MELEREGVRLRIYIGEADRYKGKPLYKYLVETMRSEGICGATVIRGLTGYGKASRIHSPSILRLSTDLPIVVEVVARRENIERLKPWLKEVVTEGLITEEKVNVVFYGGDREKL